MEMAGKTIEKQINPETDGQPIATYFKKTFRKRIQFQRIGTG
jgi:hypothetical protein